MKLFFVCLLFIAGCFADEETSDAIKYENHVAVLTDSNFKDAVKTLAPILVEFYAPWCGHCKNLAPEYEKAAQILKEKGLNVRLGKIDGTVHSEQAKEHSISGYPTLKLFNEDGKAIDYTGVRDGEGIVRWLTKKTGPASVEIKSVQESEELVENNKIVVIGFFSSLESDEAKHFNKIAKDLDDATFGISSSAEVLKHYNAKKNSAILFRNFDDPKVQFEGDFEKDFSSWVKLESMALVTEFNQNTAAQIFANDITKHFVFVYSKGDVNNTKSYEEKLTKISKEYKGKLLFVTIDTDVPSHKPVLEYFGFDEDKTPIYLVFDTKTQRKYIAKNNKKIEEDEIKSFLIDYLADKLTPFTKSADLPEDWNKNPVKILVAKNFEEVAFDKTKDVLVEFYAPWCGHCKTLEPIWEQLGEKYKDHERFVIAKMDSTANEIDQVTILSFPTIKLFKKDTNEVVDFTGERNLESFVQFLETGKLNPDPKPEGKDDGVQKVVIDKEDKSKDEVKLKHVEL